MDIKIEGNPGTGNTFQEIKIGYVENYNPNATTVINNHYGDRKKSALAADDSQKQLDMIQLQAEILDYVGHLKQFVSKDWKNRYETLWHNILNLPEVSALVGDPGKQKDTTFNRNLVANIIYIMCNQGIITETNATTLTVALEGDKDHRVRAQLRKNPDDKDLKRKIESQIINQ